MLPSIVPQVKLGQGWLGSSGGYKAFVKKTSKSKFTLGIYANEICRMLIKQSIFLRIHHGIIVEPVHGVHRREEHSLPKAAQYPRAWTH